jgi:homoserine O-succinyltransferase
MVVLPLDPPKAADPRPTDAVGEGWSCALVNNMPDSAFAETERQFLDLLDAGSGPDPLGVRLFALPGVPRGREVGRRIDEVYSPLADLVDRPPDVLVVTGANPVEQDIEDEPFWDELVGLLTWSSDHVPTMLLSCLSAHAALQVFDGIRRTPLAAKCAGVFAQTSDPDHPLSAGLGRSAVLPHSRMNAVSMDDMRASGYDLPVYSDQVGWSVATRTVGTSRVVLMQAHPEYGPTSLIREYHRDARRFVRGQRDELPVLPWRCAKGDDWDALVDLQRRLADGDRDPSMVESFPFRDVEGRAPWTWRSPARRLYSNWLAAVPNPSR